MNFRRIKEVACILINTTYKHKVHTCTSLKFKQLNTLLLTKIERKAIKYESSAYVNAQHSLSTYIQKCDLFYFKESSQGYLVAHSTKNKKD